MNLYLYYGKYIVICTIAQNKTQNNIDKFISSWTINIYYNAIFEIIKLLYFVYIFNRNSNNKKYNLFNETLSELFEDIQLVNK